MKTAYIFHDSFSDPFSDWYQWMKTTLESRGYIVTIPQFPTPAGQSLESWRAVAGKYAATFDGSTILIGHGTGAMFAMRMLQWSGKQIRGLYLVAGYDEKIGHAGYDRVNETFFSEPFPWETLQFRAMSVRVVVGENDPFVPIEISNRLAQSLGVAPDIIPDGGHLNKASGFEHFVPLASMIQDGEGMIGTGMQIQENADGAAETNIASVALPVFENVIPESSPIIVSMETMIHPDSDVPENVASENPVAVVPEQKPTSSHTMYQDMSTIVNSNRGDVASELLSHAREEEKRDQEKSPGSSKNILYIVGSLLLVIAAIGVIGYIMQVYIPAQKNATAPQVPSLLYAQSHLAIDVMKPSYAITEQVRASMTVVPTKDSIVDIYYTKGTLRAPFPSVLTALDISTLPEKLVTEFMQPMFMHGFTSSNGKPAHFLILPVSNYDSSFAGMREWEPTMLRDIGLFMNVPESFLKTKITRDEFHDEMISNRSMRVVRYEKPEEVVEDSLSFTGADAQSATGGVQNETSQTSEPSVISSQSDNPLESGSIGNATSPYEGGDPEPSNFISTGITTITPNNPFLNIVSPYDDGQVMLAYFFLTERAIVIVDNLDIIPEILSRYANRQIYQ